jgi:hypothetical protein
MHGLPPLMNAPEAHKYDRGLAACGKRIRVPPPRRASLYPPLSKGDIGRVYASASSILSSLVAFGLSYLFCLIQELQIQSVRVPICGFLCMNRSS